MSRYNPEPRPDGVRWPVEVEIGNETVTVLCDRKTLDPSGRLFIHVRDAADVERIGGASWVTPSLRSHTISVPVANSELPRVLLDADAPLPGRPGEDADANGSILPDFGGDDPLGNPWHDPLATPG